MPRLSLTKITPFVPEGGAGIGMHVILVEEAIGDMVDYVVETQKGGRYISREEDLDIFCT